MLEVFVPSHGIQVGVTGSNLLKDCERPYRTDMKLEDEQRAGELWQVRGRSRHCSHSSKEHLLAHCHRKRETTDPSVFYIWETIPGSHSNGKTFANLTVIEAYIAKLYSLHLRKSFCHRGYCHFENG